MIHYPADDFPNGAVRGKLHQVRVAQLGLFSDVLLRELSYNADGTLRSQTDFDANGNVSELGLIGVDPDTGIPEPPRVVERRVYDAADAFATDAQESTDSDGDGIPDTADPDDDNDGLTDVAEGLIGSDPLLADTDGDTFSDAVEVAQGTDPNNSNDRPLPDGDVYPCGAPDGAVDVRDARVAARVAAGDLAVPAGAALAFDRHSDVAPWVGGLPSPNGAFDVGDATVILRLASHESL